MEVTVDTSGFEAIEELWAQAPEITRQELFKSVVEAGLLVEREVKENTPTGVGGGSGLRGSIHSEAEVLSDNVLGLIGTSLAYAVPVELGTRPHRPPVEPIADWVRSKLDVPDDQVVGVAHAIANKIAKVGTEGAHMFERGFDSTSSQVGRIMSSGVERITERLASV